MTTRSANPLRTLNAHWMTEHTFYVLVFVGVAVLACIKPIAGMAAALAVIAGTALVGRMRTGIVVFAAMIPFDLQIPIGFEQPLYFDLFFGLLAIPVLVDLIKQRKQMNYRALVWLPFLLYALPVSMGRTVETRWLVATAARFLVLIVFSVAIALYGDGKRVILALGWAMVPVVVYGLYQLVTGGLGPLYTILSGSAIVGSQGNEWQGRALGFFWHPNGMGAFCGVLAGALVALASRTSDRRTSSQCYALAVVAVFGVLASGSRGAILGLAAAVLVAMALNGRKGAMRAAIALGAVVAMFAIAAQFDLLPVARESGGLDDFTKQGRLLVWGEALLLFLQHPLVGGGWANFPQMGVLAETQFGAVAHAHNWYLNTLAETGVIGFALFFGPLVWLFVRNLRVARRDATALVVIIALTVICVHSWVDVPFIEPQIGLLVACLIGLAAQQTPKEADTMVDDAGKKYVVT
jgi:putative inorganic carbon (HCO3(-)) transporter